MRIARKLCIAFTLAVALGVRSGLLAYPDEPDDCNAHGAGGWAECTFFMEGCQGSSTYRASTCQEGCDWWEAPWEAESSVTGCNTWTNEWEDPPDNVYETIMCKCRVKGGGK